MSKVSPHNIMLACIHAKLAVEQYAAAPEARHQIYPIAALPGGRGASRCHELAYSHPWHVPAVVLPSKDHCQQHPGWLQGQARACCLFRRPLTTTKVCCCCAGMACHHLPCLHQPLLLTPVYPWGTRVTGWLTRGGSPLLMLRMSLCPPSLYCTGPNSGLLREQASAHCIPAAR